MDQSQGLKVDFGHRTSALAACGIWYSEKDTSNFLRICGLLAILSELIILWASTKVASTPRYQSG